MQGGTKFSTVERENTLLVCLELEGVGFAGFQTAVNIVEVNGKTMGLVLRSFQVGHVPGDFIADLHFYDFRTLMTPDQRGVNRYLVALSDHLFPARFHTMFKPFLLIAFDRF